MLGKIFLHPALALGFCLGGSVIAQENTVTSGLKLWLKADAGVTADANGFVSSWADQSPEDPEFPLAALQEDPVRQPKLVADAINGKPALRFDGATAADQVDYLDVQSAQPIEIWGDISTFFVIRPDDFGTFRAVWGKTQGNQPASTDFYAASGTGVPVFFRGDGFNGNARNVNGVVRFRAGAPVVYGVTHGDTSVTHYFNGQPAGTGTISAVLGDLGDPLRIGSRGDLVTKMKGDIAEILIYDRALSAEEVAQVTDYLKQKYGIINEPPSVVITAPANNSTVTAPAEVVLTATATDPDSDIAAVDFFVNGVRVGTASRSPYSLPISLETPGTVTFGVQATDVKDARSSVAEVTVTVNAGPTQPELPLENLALWLKADDGISVAEGETVMEWLDRSGNGNHVLQPNWDLAPIFVSNAINGKPAARFDGFDDYLESPDSESLALTGDIATFAVLRADDFDGFRAIWAQTSGNVPRPNDWYLTTGSGISRFFRGTDSPAANVFVDSAAPIPANTPVILGVNQTGTSVTQYLNGSPFGGGNISIQPSDAGTPLKIGSRDDFFTKMKGDIAEIIIYSASLDAEDLAAARRYLGTKYGLPWVRAVHSAPTVNLTAPTGGAVVTTPATISIAATAQDTGGSIARVEFLANGSVIATDLTEPYAAELSVTVAGDVVFTAAAYDNFGNRTESAPVTITANAPEPLPIPADGLQLWLRADKGVTKDGEGRVSMWEDFSGKFNHARQQNMEAAPTLGTTTVNNAPALVFDGADDQLEIGHSTSLAITGDISTFFVVNFTDFEGYRAVWAKTSSNQPRPNDYYILPNSGIPQVIRGGFGQNAFIPAFEAVPQETDLILGWDQEGAVVNHYLNNNNIGSGEIQFALEDGGASTFIGTRGDGFTRMRGAIAEIVIYNRALTPEQRLQVYSYLAEKYGIGSEPEEGVLSVSLDGASLVIRWTESTPPFQLQGTNSLSEPQWNLVTGDATMENGVVTVRLNREEAAQFFRLERLQ